MNVNNKTNCGLGLAGDLTAIYTHTRFLPHASSKWCHLVLAKKLQIERKFPPKRQFSRLAVEHYWLDLRLVRTTVYSRFDPRPTMSFLATKATNAWRHWVVLWKRYPLCRGMVTYSIVWPVSSICQQRIAGKKEIDWKQVARFSFYGGCYVAPTLFFWVRLSSNMWPAMNLKNGIRKALVEQVSYGPFAMTSFFFLMTLLEGRGVEAAKQEVSTKFWSTYKVGVCFWPIMQTINFGFLPEKNRVPFVGACSFVWTIFLSYMKSLDAARRSKHPGHAVFGSKATNRRRSAARSDG
ncbi:Hypothetical predicted protein [Cloeon dipterum]|uniref:Mpv17-like protein n=1 Tax=Cloeon dipterum TaxID=197152 RepID=A0A8S1C2T0_9INSE|nr:Hypothetical predicted protein [Cloeon dipterum]